MKFKKVSIYADLEFHNYLKEYFTERSSLLKTNQYINKFCLGGTACIKNYLHLF